MVSTENLDQEGVDHTAKRKGDHLADISEKRSKVDIPVDAIATPIDLSIKLNRGDPSPLFSLIVEQSWAELLKKEFQEMYLHDLTRFLNSEISKYQVFPELSNVFRALNSCQLKDVKVVILGQDPYHDDNQAMGLSFSVPSSEKIPGSLLNMFKEIESDLGLPRSRNGDLSHWASQGVLLLNACLTVRAHTANSHSDKGWERFTDAVIRLINEKCDNVVFMLWGKFADKKGARVDSRKHRILKAAHPSGLSASRGFFACKHFSKANEYLIANGKEPIDWSPQQ